MALSENCSFDNFVELFVFVFVLLLLLFFPYDVSENMFVFVYLIVLHGIFYIYIYILCKLVNLRRICLCVYAKRYQKDFFPITHWY